jgi:hypothetical protein
MHPIIIQDIARARHEDDLRRACRARLAALRRRILARSGGSDEGSPIVMRQLYPRAARGNLAAVAAIEAILAFAWFGWTLADAPASFAITLVIGTGVALLVGAESIAIAYRLRADPSLLGGAGRGRRYRTIVGMEFGTAAIGATTLGAIGAERLIPAWVCLIVGIHFVALDHVSPGMGMRHLAVAMSSASVAGFAVSGTGVLPSTVTGPIAGVCLLAHAAWMLLAVRHRSFDDRYPTRALKVLYAPPVSSEAPFAAVEAGCPRLPVSEPCRCCSVESA